MSLIRNITCTESRTRWKEHKPGPVMRTATSLYTLLLASAREASNAPLFSIDRRAREARIDFVSHGVRFRIHSRPTDRNQGESVRPSRRKPFSANKGGGGGKGGEGEGIGMGAAYRAPPNKHPREFLRAFLHILVFSEYVRESIFYPRISIIT